MWWVFNITPRPLYSRERPGTHYIGGWVGLRASLDRCGKSRRPPGFDSRNVPPVASRYTDYAIPAHTSVGKSLNSCSVQVCDKQNKVPNVAMERLSLWLFCRPKFCVSTIHWGSLHWHIYMIFLSPSRMCYSKSFAISQWYSPWFNAA
jgi:hypothetical protein